MEISQAARVLFFQSLEDAAHGASGLTKSGITPARHDTLNIDACCEMNAVRLPVLKFGGTFGARLRLKQQTRNHDRPEIIVERWR